MLRSITALFPVAKPSRQPVKFSWRLGWQKKHPFLLLPEKSGTASDTIHLSSAPRPLGLVIFQTVVLLVDRVRRQNVLFSQIKR